MNILAKIVLSAAIISIPSTKVEGKDHSSNTPHITANTNIIKKIDSHINGAIAEKAFPGAQLIIGTKYGEVYSRNYGYNDYSEKVAVTDETIYDLASCTKIFATTLSIMHLIQQDSINIEKKIGEVLPKYCDTEFAGVSIKELLYHSSGFKSGISIAQSLVKTTEENKSIHNSKLSEDYPYCFDYKYYIYKDLVYDSTFISTTADHLALNTEINGSIKITDHLLLSKSYQISMDSMINAAYVPEKRGTYRYSDLNFHILKEVIEGVTNSTLDKYTSFLYDTLHIENIGYNPREWCDMSLITPTEYDALFRKDTIHGIVHDEFACVIGGVGGHAGLFANAKALSKFCEMFLNNGNIPNQTPIFTEQTLQEFTTAKRFSSGALRGLGFDKLNSEKMPYDSESYGHTGYTGTYFWVDPTNDIYVILLTNRVHPTRSNKKLTGSFRSELWKMAQEVAIRE